ncbi:unnamed protein product [Cuscuta campestris]|uniref:Transposase Tnp1/En/Spm-like domain-containing protein n=1 Tax=Cuscuta campestris TaxID=132261 RepID=A0A484LT57_9ASTE|nr:unnamed protein product [Cuscuta campestris]
MFRSKRTFEEYQHLLENEVPEGFNDDEEVLTIDAQGNVSKLRGRISVKVVVGLDAGTRILVPMNKLLQPVKKAGGLFNRFLADIAKRPRFCPLNYSDWRVVPTLYKKRILEFIKKKFVLPSTDSVQDKILSTVGERLRGYKRTLRKKYIQKGTTKEDLYNIPLAESGANEGLVRPREVDDAMWAGFVTLSFSPDVENSAMAIIKKKTGACHFSEETREAEKFAYKKLMGPQPEKGKVTGLGRGVNARDLRKIRCEAEPTAMAKILRKLQTMEDENQKMKDQIASLTSKFGDHSPRHTDSINCGDFHEDSTQDSPFKGCTTPEVPRHDASIRSEYREVIRYLICGGKYLIAKDQIGVQV